MESIPEFDLQLPHPRDASLVGRHWPVDSPRGWVYLIHGLGDHSGRYDSLVRRCHAEGLAVVAFDQPGHGRSPGKRGCTPGYQPMLERLTAGWHLAQSCYPQQPGILYGHSMGGNYAANLVLRDYLTPAALVLSSPWIGLAFEPSRWLVALAAVVGRVYPGFTQPNGLDLDALCRDPAVVDAYRRDPLVHDRISPALFFQTRQAARQIPQRLPGLQTPTWLMHGDADRITCFAASQQLAEQATAAGLPLEWHPWPGGYHELHHEPDNGPLMQSLLQWMTGQLDPADG